MSSSHQLVPNTPVGDPDSKSKNPDDTTELDNIFLKNENITQIILQAQTCLLNASIKKSLLTKRVVYAIKQQLGRNLSYKMVKNLDSVVKQIIQDLDMQQEKYFDYLIAYFLKEAMEIRNAKFNLKDRFIQEINLCMKKLGLKDTTINLRERYISDLSNQNIQKDVAIFNESHYQTQFSGRFNKVFSPYSRMAIILVIYVLVVLKLFTSEYTSANRVLFVFLASSLLSRGMRAAIKFKIEYDVAKEIENILIKDLPKIHLEKVVVKDFKNNVVGTTYLPNVELVQFPKIEDVAEVRDVKAFKPLIKSPAPKRVKSIAANNPPYLAIPRPIKSKEITWPGNSVLFGNLKTPICFRNAEEKTDAFKMVGAIIPKNIIYYGFFNQHALRTQNFSDQNPDWKTHQAIVKEGDIVGPRGETGIKSLARPEKILMQGQNLNGFFMVCTWETKKKTIASRVLGTTGPTQLSDDGTRHTLVDFWRYEAEGLHK